MLGLSTAETPKAKHTRPNTLHTSRYAGTTSSLVTQSGIQCSSIVHDIVCPGLSTTWLAMAPAVGPGGANTTRATGYEPAYDRTRSGIYLY